MKKKKVFIILVIIIVIALIIIIGNRKKLSFVEKSIKDGYSYIVKYASVPFEYVHNKFKELTVKENLYEENQNLKQQISNLENLKIENKQLKSDIENLKSLLELNEVLSEYNKIYATIIDRNLGYWYDTFIIDKGENNGIKIGQAVITNNGLIGYIDSTNYLTSTVKLITSEKSNKITVKIESDKYVYGILSGYDSGYLVIKNVEEDVSIGSIVTTAGLGTSFPEGIYIGIVDKIENDKFDLIKTIKVKPIIDYNLISNVCILERK